MLYTQDGEQPCLFGIKTCNPHASWPQHCSISKSTHLWLLWPLLHRYHLQASAQRRGQHSCTEKSLIFSLYGDQQAYSVLCSLYLEHNQQQQQMLPGSDTALSAKNPTCCTSSSCSTSTQMHGITSAWAALRTWYMNITPTQTAGMPFNQYHYCRDSHPALACKPPGLMGVSMGFNGTHHLTSVTCYSRLQQQHLPVAPVAPVAPAYKFTQLRW